MTLTILEEKSNPLFHRKEITARIHSAISPSRSHAIDLIAKKLSTLPENVKIKKIEGKFGSQTFSIEANVYTSQAHKDGIELKKKKDQSKSS